MGIKKRTATELMKAQPPKPTLLAEKPKPAVAAVKSKKPAVVGRPKKPAVDRRSEKVILYLTQEEKKLLAEKSGRVATSIFILDFLTDKGFFNRAGKDD